MSELTTDICKEIVVNQQLFVYYKLLSIHNEPGQFHSLVQRHTFNMKHFLHTPTNLNLNLSSWPLASYKSIYCQIFALNLFYTKSSISLKVLYIINTTTYIKKSKFGFGKFLGFILTNVFILQFDWFCHNV